VLALPDEEGRRLTIAYAEGDGAEATRGQVLPAGESLSGRVLATGEAVTSADFAADERAARSARGAMSQIGPAVVFPLGAPGNVRGVLSVLMVDNGIGIPAGVTRSGLRNLASRAEKLGGELRLGPADPGSPVLGTRLEWRVPCC
jgi:hypothetical protein